jgi:NADH-quinone oxidoreductase subunit C
METRELNPGNAELADAIEARFGTKLTRLDSGVGELGYRVAAHDLLAVCLALRDEDSFRFEMLMDLCAVDYLVYGRDEWSTDGATGTGFSRGVFRDGPMPADVSEPEPLSWQPPARFAVVYHLLSIAHNRRLRLKVFCVDDARPLIESVTEIWASADWYEREAFDLYGVLFRGHPDLRRLLTDYGFIGHPFRKDFPLVGNVEVRYDPEKGRVVYEPVSIEPRTLVPKVIRVDARYDPELGGGGDA